LLIKGQLTPGDVFTVFFSVLVGAFALGNAVPFVSTIAIAQGSGAVVFEVIDSEPNIDPYSKEGYVPDRIEGKIQFKGLNFAYPSRPTVKVSTIHLSLHEMNFPGLKSIRRLKFLKLL
ncbi:unnamed protein product, partial [Allacma fusca]